MGSKSPGAGLRKKRSDFDVTVIRADRTLIGLAARAKFDKCAIFGIVTPAIAGSSNGPASAGSPAIAGSRTGGDRYGGIGYLYVFRLHSAKLERFEILYRANGKFIRTA